MAEKIKTDLNKLLLDSKINKVQFQNNMPEKYFSLSKPKVVNLRIFLSSLSFPKFWKQNFIYFGLKHIKTGPNCSHKLVTFLKYQTNNTSLNKFVR